MQQSAYALPNQHFECVHGSAPTNCLANWEKSSTNTERFTKTSTIEPMITYGVQCAVNCTVSYPSIWSYTWQRIDYTTTVTAATIVYIVNTKANTTRTVTKSNKLPYSYELPPTNAAGTQVATITVQHWPNGTTTTVL